MGIFIGISFLYWRKILKQTKFTFNSLMIVIIIFSAIMLFFTVKMTSMADRTAVNSFNKIEGSDYAVKYSSLEKSGIYKGSENSSELIAKGKFGFDWGAVLNGNELIINEYKTSDMGFVICDVVKIDLKKKTKETLFADSILRGQNKSGEIVIVSNYYMPSNYPTTNKLVKLYEFFDFKPLNSKTESEICFFDLTTLKPVFTKKGVITKDFEKRYLEKTLEEIKN